MEKKMAQDDIKNEMDQVIEGRDLWMGKSEVLERWNNKTTS